MFMLLPLAIGSVNILSLQSNIVVEHLTSKFEHDCIACAEIVLKSPVTGNTLKPEATGTISSPLLIPDTYATNVLG